ncbi:hypothetical protein QYE76_070942 [Lolium multiflorum]|uniref:Uncharacterized protein n=1 Tax=Lolium multiflorum TaxID=4521 RepID=A0AAD8SJ45_LOLMU|nr:hypothetical protein QYE76_070942 [Lolium multiflorum]
MDSGASLVSCKWVKPQGPPKGFDFDVTKAEQIFDLLLKEKQLKLPEGHKIPTVQELNGKPYRKWHNTFTHATNDRRVWRQQGLGTTGKDGDEGSCSHSKDKRKPLHAIGSVTMASATSQRRSEERKISATLSDHLLNKYVGQYDQRRRYNDDGERDRLARGRQETPSA